jgi:hypothetical protein
MLKKLFTCALTIGTLGIGSVVAQDLGPFPVDRVRESPEDDLITNARLSTTSYGFLKLTTNARAAGMGDAYSAVGNDLGSIFYNPAGITQLETERAVMGGYTKWIVGSSLGTAAFAVKTQVATFGVGDLLLDGRVRGAHVGEPGRHGPDGQGLGHGGRVHGG